MQVNLFRNIWDRIKEAGAYLLNSRLVMLILVFCLSSSILIGRLFYLQIVKGEDYLQNYEAVYPTYKHDPGNKRKYL